MTNQPKYSAPLVIIRGHSGSGKSTLARTKYAKHVLVEADMYRFNSSGEYVFKPFENSQAHEWCKNRVVDLLEAGFPVVVCNTFIKLWELEFYLNLSYDTEVVTCKNNFENTHNVPKDAVEMQKLNFEEFPQ